MIPTIALSPFTNELVLSTGKDLRRKSSPRRILIVGGGVTGLTVRSVRLQPDKCH
jgi:pyruvate/2-oxoglutarate dehydrogenase complex dihydrolipoamide dehydrogenase (E3) component